MNCSKFDGRSLPAILLCASFSQVAYPIGLGNIKVYTRLNEPFKATIEMIETDAIPLRDLRVLHADKAEYKRAGLVYSEDLGYLRYAVKGDVSRPYILITSKENVAEPFINILLKLQWPNGEVFRAYSILLDPPEYQLERITSQQSIKISKRDQAPNAQKISKRDQARASNSVAPQPKQMLPDEDVPVSHTIVARQSDTLWNIARRIQEKREDLSVYQIMISVYRANRSDFINQDINLLKKHARLEIPTYKKMSNLSYQSAYTAFESHVNKTKSHKVQSIPTKQISEIKDAPVFSERVKATDTTAIKAAPEEFSGKVHQPELEKPVATQEIPKPDASTGSDVQTTTQAPIVSKPDGSVEIVPQPMPSQSNTDEQSQSQAKPKTSTSQPQLQMNEAVPDDADDESNLWFLDTFNFNEEEGKQSKQNQSKSRHKQKKQQVAQKQMKVESKQPDNVVQKKAEAKKKAQPQQSSSADHRSLLKMIAHQNQKIDKYVLEVRELNKRINNLSIRRKKGAVQAAAIENSDDNFWEIFWFITTLIGLSSTIYLSYRLYLLSKIDTADAATSDMPDYALAQDSISMSKRKVEPESLKDTAQAIDEISDRTGSVKVEKESAVAPEASPVGEPVTEESLKAKTDPKPKSTVHSIHHNEPASVIEEAKVDEDSAQTAEVVTETVQVDEVQAESPKEDKPAEQVIPVVDEPVVEHHEPMVEEIILDDHPVASPEVTETAVVDSTPEQPEVELVTAESPKIVDEPTTEQPAVASSPAAATENKDAHVMEFDSSLSGKYKLGAKGGERHEGVTANIDMPGEELSEQSESYQIGRKGERQEDGAIESIDLPADDQETSQVETTASKEPESDAADDETKSSSASSATIGTKIDLATAYITMDDKVNARAILNEIMAEGNEREVDIAKKLLDELDNG